MERSGMRWSKVGTQAMLDVRSEYLNGDWKEFHAFRIEHQTERLYPHRQLLEGVQVEEPDHEFPHGQRPLRGDDCLARVRAGSLGGMGIDEARVGFLALRGAVGAEVVGYEGTVRLADLDDRLVARLVMEV